MKEEKKEKNDKRWSEEDIPQHRTVSDFLVTVVTSLLLS
jgi:hypothetical protein